MVPKLVYLDTNLWNRLLDQGADPTELLAELKRRDATLVLSAQTVYELTRTFHSSPTRGMELFRYLMIYIDVGVVGTYDNMDLLRNEVRALYARADSVEAYFNTSEYGLLKSEVAKLAEGNLDDRVSTFIAGRTEFATTSREQQKAHFEKRPDVKERLLAVPKSGLGPWLDEQVHSNVGAAMLTRHLIRIYESTETDAAISTALGLLQHPASRIAKALVRADLYSNWRCAHRGSNPRDLVDDMYHVLNASYADVYATGEGGQKDYASLLLSQRTRPEFYDDCTNLAEWLVAI
jgi:hypothetical protein